MRRLARTSLEVPPCGSIIAQRPRIVHVTGDFPDLINPNKTPVIERLIALTGDRFDHKVVSINRRSPRWSSWGKRTIRHPWSPPLTIEKTPIVQGWALTYDAPPKGLYHGASLSQLGDWLASQLAADPPDLIVGHKLTIEGIAVARAAQALQIPYALTLQGKTDAEIIRVRRDLSPLYRRIYHEASAVVSLAPWVIQRVEERLGRRREKVHLVPAPTELDHVLPPLQHGHGLVSMFHLHNWRGKNLPGLLTAHRMFASKSVSVPLTIFGGGSAADEERCRGMVPSGAPVVFAGHIDRVRVPKLLNPAIAFVMPSLGESFGLVFIEALFAGLPIIYPEGQGVSGYFDDAPFAIAVPPGDPAAIAAAMIRVVREESVMKAALSEWQVGTEAHKFTRAAVGSAFAAALEDALQRTSDARAVQRIGF